MALQIEVEDIEQVAEPLREHYEKVGEKFRLAGIPDTTTLEGALKKERDTRKEHEKRLKDVGEINVEEYRELKKLAEDQKKKKMVDAGKIDELLAESGAQLEAKFAKERDAITQENQTLKSQVKNLVINDRLKESALKLAAHEAALPDIVKRADGVWDIQDGQPVALSGDGTPILKEGHRITLDEWIADLQSSAPHLFKQSKGAGVNPGAGNGVQGGPVVKRSEMDSYQKSQYVAKYGQEAYLSLPQ